jgi:hypothetical protein
LIGQDSPPPQDLTRALVQAKTIYLVLGHVKYYKTKGFKTRLVDDSPFEEPSHQELEKWGRFQVVQDAKNADLIVRIYETGTMHPIPLGTVNTGSGVVILDVGILPQKRFCGTPRRIMVLARTRRQRWTACSRNCGSM